MDASQQTTCGSGWPHNMLRMRLRISIFWCNNSLNTNTTQVVTTPTLNSTHHLSYSFTDHSVMSHISAIELLASQLKDLNEPVTEAQVMTKILVTLPPSFRHFLSVWDNVPAKNRNIQTLTQRLLKEENVTKIYNNGQSDAADSAFFSNNFPPQQSDRHSRGGFHNRRSRGGRHGRGAGTRHPYIRKCNYCGDTTHLYASCQERLRNERDNKGSPGEISNLAKDSNKNQHIL